MNRRILTVALIIGVAPFTTGCSSMSHTGQDAVAGGAIGAVSGAIIDKATGGRGGPGALIGAVAGTAIGAAVGSEKDQKEKAALQARADAAAVAANQVGIADVIQMSQNKQSDDLIVNQIRTTNSTYTLSTEDVRMMSSNGVSDRVIMEMQSRRPEAIPRTRYVAAPTGTVYVTQPAPVYVYPPPPPPLGVGVIIRR